MDKPTRLEQHDRAYASFVRLVRSLTPEQLLRRGTAWAPRDVVAHLIGWNRNIRLGCDEIRAGRTPFYHSDAANDYRNINAEFIAKYNSTDGDTLLQELAEASRALREYFEGTSEVDWSRDFGPQHYRGGAATIDRCAEFITREYEEHGKEIAAAFSAARDRIIVAEREMTTKKFPINRAPVLTLWAFVIAMRQGHDEDSALTLGQGLAALNAQSKGRRLGIYEAPEKQPEETTKKAPGAAAVRLLGRDVPIVKAAWRPGRAGRRGHQTRGREDLPGKEVRRTPGGDARGHGGAGEVPDAGPTGDAWLLPVREVPPADPGGQEGMGREGGAGPGSHPPDGQVRRLRHTRMVDVAVRDARKCIHVLIPMPISSVPLPGDEESLDSSSQVAWLRSLGDREALFQVMNGDRPSAQSLEAAEALAQLGDVRGLDHLIATLNNPGSGLRMEAAEILRHLHHPRGTRALRESGTETQSSARAAQREEVYEDLNAAKTDELVAIWHENNHAEWTDLELEVIEAILTERLGKLPRRRMGVDESQEIDDEVDPRIQQLWKQGDIDRLRLVMEREAEIPRRLEAAEAMADLGQEDGLDFLIEMLDDDEEEHSEMAAELLDWLDLPRGNAALRDRDYAFETSGADLIEAQDAEPRREAAPARKATEPWTSRVPTMPGGSRRPAAGAGCIVRPSSLGSIVTRGAGGALGFLSLCVGSGSAGP